MIKFAAKVLFLMITFLPISQASLITNLSEAELATGDYAEANDFLTSELENINYISRDGWDIAWASPVNAEFWYGLPTQIEYDSGEKIKNTLYSPLLQKNWLFVEQTNLDLTALISSLSLADFVRKDSNDNDVYIQATQYFNSHFHYVDANNLESGQMRSAWVDEDSSDMFTMQYFGQFETLYVRKSEDRPLVSQVPEPTTLMIFALALIALSLRSRLVK